MSEKIEGTMRLEGLIEGTMPPFPDAKSKVEKWAEDFAGGKVRINVQFDGSHFSAMPASEAVMVKDISPDGLEPANAIADGLSDLLRYFPPLERSQVFSTLRSVEYRAKLEVQTLYAVGPEGRAVTRQQTVPCDTTRTDEPLSGREMLKRGIIGVAFAAVILGISTFFIDYRSAWRHLTARTEPVTATVNAASFAPYFSVEVTGLDLGNGTLQLKIKRTAAYPRNEAALDALYNDPPMPIPDTMPAATAPATGTAPTTTAPAATSAPAATTTVTSAPAAKPPELPSMIRRRLAVEALVKGLVWLDFYDKDGNLIGGAMVRVDGLAHGETVDAAVSAPVVNRQTVAPARIVVLPQ